MNESLAITFELLAQSENEAAVEALVPALDSAHSEIRQAALGALLHRNELSGHREIVSRLDRHGEEWHPLLDVNRGRLTHALRGALVDAEPLMGENACRAIVRYHEYDLMPALVSVLEHAAEPMRDLAAATLLELAELLHVELVSPRDYRNRRDPQLVRRHVMVSLEQSVSRYNLHQRKEVLEAFLLLAPRDNCTLQQVLLDPLHGSYLGLIDALLHSQRGGATRLLLSYLEDPHPPSAAVSALARRDDEPFVRALLKKIGPEPSIVAKTNLKRLESIAWLKPQRGLLETLDDEAQHSAVRLLMATSAKSSDALEVVAHLAQRGTPAGRRAAYEALAEFQDGKGGRRSVDAAALILRGLQDPDPWVQAAAVRQLRPRGVPGALPRLIGLIDSPHELVRQAARESLSEFQFPRFLASFDMLEPAVRASTGPLVRRIDPQAVLGLLDEMESSARTRRRRAIEIATAMQVLAEVEPQLLELLDDDDYLIRVEAACVLAASDSPEVVDALRHAALDHQAAVQLAAKASLEKIGSRAASPVLTSLPVPSGVGPSRDLVRDR